MGTLGFLDRGKNMKKMANLPKKTGTSQDSALRLWPGAVDVFEAAKRMREIDGKTCNLGLLYLDVPWKLGSMVNGSMGYFAYL